MAYVFLEPYRFVKMKQSQEFLTHKLRQAKQLHAKEVFGQAQDAYLVVLKYEGKNAEALHGLGLIAYAQGRYGEAVDYMNRAIKVQANPYYLNNRGTAYFSQGEFSQAQTDYKKALKIQPEFVDAQFNLANLYCSTQRLPEAIELFNQLIGRHPDYLEALYNRGNTHAQLQQFHDACQDYNHVLELNPHHLEALLNRGNAFLAMAEIDLAIASYTQALTLQPQFFAAYLARAGAYTSCQEYGLGKSDYHYVLQHKPDSKESYFGLGNILKEQFLFKEAIAWYYQALAIDGNYFDALTNLAHVLRRIKLFDEAAVNYSKAAQVSPHLPQAYANLGNVLHDLKRSDLAIDAYVQALELDPLNQQALFNLGNIFKELNQLDEALQQFEYVLTIDADDIEAHFAKGMVLLTQGNYPEGFKLYAYRWRRQSLLMPLRKYSQPLWTGKESLQGKVLLIYAEQGLGDSIQFSRLLPQITKRGGRIIFEVQKSLVTCLQSLEGNITLITQQDPPLSFDYYCPLLNLPTALELTLDSIPLAGGYLRAKPDYVSKWRNKLKKAIKPRIGLVCSGNPMHENDHNRSIFLADVMPWLPQEFEYYILQKEIREVDRELLKNYPLCRVFENTLEDFEDTAALCTLMDIVISVDTSVAHLSGALGKKTWLLLPYCPDWRWLLARVDTPWYQSMKLYRQEFTNQWQSTLSQLSKDLKAEYLAHESANLS